MSELYAAFSMKKNEVASYRIASRNAGERDRERGEGGREGREGERKR